MSERLECPKCHASEPVCGIEVCGVYDGVLFWECLEDGTRWHRWPEGHRLRSLAERTMLRPAIGGGGTNS